MRRNVDIVAIVLVVITLACVSSGATHYFVGVNAKPAGMTINGVALGMPRKLTHQEATSSLMSSGSSYDAFAHANVRYSNGVVTCVTGDTLETDGHPILRKGDSEERVIKVLGRPMIVGDNYDRKLRYIPQNLIVFINEGKATFFWLQVDNERKR